MARKARWRALAHLGLIACITFACAKKIETPSSGAIVAAAPVASPMFAALDRTARITATDDELSLPSSKRQARTASNRRGLRTQVVANKLSDVHQLWLIGNGLRR